MSDTAAFQGIRGAMDRVFEAMTEAVEEPIAPRVTESGTVQYVGQGIARVRGLPGARSEELVRFKGGTVGMVLNLDATELGVVLLGSHEGVQAGSTVRRTHRVLSVPVGESLLGRVVTPLGEPLDRSEPIRTTDRWPIERPAPAILDRAPVRVPLQTGLKVVDAMIPVGRGQRELILGDRQTGKTTVAVDAILNQADTGVICLYCAIGQRTSAVAQVVETLRANEALDHSIVVVASGEEPPGISYIAPYAATAMAEYFMEKGRDVLVVYDDLTKHARAYRELSLLLRRPPGREAFPGDIFYIHARLLERATNLRDGGSLTALPVVETEAENLAAYIPTNLVSITDGQIYLSPSLVQKGILPAVDVGLSVSRVGGKTQLPAYRSVVGDLKLTYAQFSELEAFARFGTGLEAETRRRLEHGRRVRELLKQHPHEPMPVAEQIVVLLAVSDGCLDDAPLALLPWLERQIRERLRKEQKALCRRIEEGAPLSERDRAALIGLAEAVWKEAEER